MENTSFGVSNFKCFAENTNISIRPITINIGPNNSGKSSMIKSLEILSKSCEGLSNNYEDILSNIYSYKIKNLGTPSTFLNNPEKELCYTIDISSESLSSIYSNHKVQIMLFFAFNVKSIVFTEYKNRDEVHNNPGSFETVYNNYFRGEIKERPGRGELVKYQIIIDNIPIIELSKELDKGEANIIAGDGTELFRGKINFITPIKIKSFFDVTKLLAQNSNKQELKVKFHGDTFTNLPKLKIFLANTFEKNEIQNSVELLDLINTCLTEVVKFQNEVPTLNYITLNRRENKRFIDNESTSMFKTSMELYYDEKMLGSVVLILSKILPLFGLPSKVDIHYENDFGFQFYLIDSKGNRRNIADYGSGINQLLPVILAASTFSEENPLIFEGTQLTKKDFFCKSIIIIEEPESNLHPNMQSKLADMFTLLLNERNQNFIIETHSEYLVRRFQNLIASGKLSHENIIINYFWNDESKHNCKQIQFKEDGGLDDTFENGFFDESLMLELDLLRIKNLN